MANCFDCKHFYTTWKNNTPRGCKAYGIEANELPSRVISKHTSEGCISFINKKQIKKETIRSSGFDFSV